MLVAREVDVLSRQHSQRLNDFRRSEQLGRADHIVQWQRPQRPAWMREALMACRLASRMVNVLQLLPQTRAFDLNYPAAAVSRPIKLERRRTKEQTGRLVSDSDFGGDDGP
jgi:hypothetical protein